MTRAWLSGAGLCAALLVGGCRDLDIVSLGSTASAAQGPHAGEGAGDAGESVDAAHDDDGDHSNDDGKKKGDGDDGI